MTVYIVIFDRKAYQISGKLFADIASYIWPTGKNPGAGSLPDWAVHGWVPRRSLCRAKAGRKRHRVWRRHDWDRCRHQTRFGPTANVSTYIDASGTKPILELYQSMGKIESRMVVVVHAGKRPMDILEMTYSQHALIGSGGYNPENVEDVLAVMVQSRGICAGGCRSAKAFDTASQKR